MPGWAWMILGILLTLLAVAFVPRLLKPGGDGFFRPTPNPDAQPAPVAVDELPAPAARRTDGPAAGGGNASGEQPRRGSQYDFYTVLPGREVPMTDAELAATQREEAERLARQQQEATAAGNEDAAELALPAPVPAEQAPAQAPAQPAGSQASAQSPDAAPTTGAGIGDGSRYLLQAGAFEASGQAEELKARIALLGLTARVESARINDRTVYRVRMGPYGTAGDLAEAKQKLANGGLDALAIKVQ
nr:SPOR domain-containing protein [Lysobacter sp. GX 14042]